MLQSLVVQPMMRLLALASLATIPSEISHDVEEKIYSTSRDMKMFSLNPLSPSNPLNPFNPVNPLNPINPLSPIKGVFNNPCLPQFDKNPIDKISRKNVVRRKQFDYQFNYKTNIPEAPMLGPHPILKIHPNEKPSPTWLKLAGNALHKIVDDTLKSMAIELIEDNNYMNLFQLASTLVPIEFYRRPPDFQAYLDIFVTKPPVVYDFDMDEAFARWRLSGPNPTTIQQCDRETLMEKVYMDPLPMNVTKAIQKALHDNRLFIVDYSVMATMRSGINKDFHGEYQKYNFAPLALFEVPVEPKTRDREWLKVMAIQTNKLDRRLSTMPAIFTPQDGMKWRMAKAAFNSADANFHEGVVHLGRTHLVAESFMVGTHRTLPPRHPIYALIVPHFKGTAFINLLADKTLISPNNMVDHLTNPNIYDLEKVIGQSVLEKMKDDFTFPAMIKQRNMTTEIFKAPYPYRDDGMLVWDAIRNWVEDYLHLYYGQGDSEQSDRIQNDDELRNWVNEMKSENGGRARWLDSFYASRNPFKMLCDVLAAVIFTASAQHAVVNFSQQPMHSFTPAFPLALYTPPPKQNDEPSMQDYLNMLPPMEMAQAQKNLATILSTVQYTTLGEYAKSYFSDPKVYSPLIKFQAKLKEIEMIIENRNKDRVAPWLGIISNKAAQNWAYPFLLPSHIPQSINI